MRHATDDEALHLGLALARAHARQQQRLEEHLGLWHGLALSDFLLLRVLAQSPEGRLATLPLAHALSVSPSALVRQLLPLEKTGLLIREAGTVRLRPVGRQLHGEAAQTVGAACAGAWRGVSMTEDIASALRSQLDAVACNAAGPAPRAWQS
ncbi:hypothetical protein [Paracidovorax wautersii]|uniref:DNA-binding transcriptional regulator, MarR family n=1 Tax=Paracidovorax wautersii TaxID=1177982 RepID=A0A1I2AMJ1_9BURK|nr:hypothetical protein [Paracidovorax wautersii]SFE44080.1 hypothetical protein SAMN04489711_10261 [Paracidovorax wautersii]